jgi:hypothetical protein
MGIEDDFYATVKLKSGEEIFARVAPSEEEDRTLLIITNPIILSEVKTRLGSGYKMEPWLKTTSDDMFVINLDDVLTMNESSDMEMIMMYQSYLRQAHKFKNKQTSIDRKMGYISTVNDAKKILEKIYKSI